MRTIEFINWKGGVGKTMLSINTAYYFAHQEELNVLFIDMDKQGNASTWFDADPNNPTLADIFRRSASIDEVIQPTRYENIDLVAADASLLDVNIEILKDPTGRQDNILKEALLPIIDDYQICIIDNPPDSNIPVLNGLTMVDDIIAVTLPNEFSMNGISQLQGELDNYNEQLGLNLTIEGVVVNQMTSYDFTVYEKLSKRYRMLPSIRGGKCTQRWLDKVVNTHQSIYEVCPQSGYARDLNKFLGKIIELIEASYTSQVVL